MIKKFSFTNKAIAFMLAASLPLTVLAGCQSKNAAANVASGPAANSSNNGSNNQNGAAPNSDQFKQRMSDNIKSLVDDKTITQEQADKIVAALNENMQSFGGGNRQKDTQNGQKNNNQGSTQNGQNNQQSNGQNRQNGRNGQETSALNKLVTDGVITQAQADAVMQKIRGNFNRPQNNQNQQNPQNQQNSQSKQGA